MIRRSLFEVKKSQISTIPRYGDIEVKRLKVRKGGTVWYNRRSYRENYRYVGEYIIAVDCESDQIVPIFTDKKWSLIEDHPSQTIKYKHCGGCNNQAEPIAKDVFRTHRYLLERL